MSRTAFDSEVNQACQLAMLQMSIEQDLEPNAAILAQVVRLVAVLSDETVTFICNELNKTGYQMDVDSVTLEMTGVPLQSLTPAEMTKLMLRAYLTAALIRDADTRLELLLQDVTISGRA